jgi:hypothetical protein
MFYFRGKKILALTVLRKNYFPMIESFQQKKLSNLLHFELTFQPVWVLKKHFPAKHLGATLL